jgi:hypothetical protein
MSEVLDLLGDPVIDRKNLRDRFIEPPFSVLDGRSDVWLKRKLSWVKLGLKSEVGRDFKVYGMQQLLSKINNPHFKNISIFNPVLCELMYHWFCPENGKILDPFAGGGCQRYRCS